MWVESVVSQEDKGEPFCRIDRAVVDPPFNNGDHDQSLPHLPSTDPSELIAQCLHDITRAYNGTWCQSYIVADIERIIAGLETPSNSPMGTTEATPGLIAAVDRSSLIFRILRATKEQISAFLVTTFSLLRKPAVRVRTSFFRTWAYCTKRSDNQRSFADHEDCEKLLTTVEWHSAVCQSAARIVRQELRQLSRKFGVSQMVTFTEEQVNRIQKAYFSADLILKHVEEGQAVTFATGSSAGRSVLSSRVRQGIKQGRPWKVTMTKGTRQFNPSVSTEEVTGRGETESLASITETKIMDRAHPLVLNVFNEDYSDVVPTRSASTDTCFSSPKFDASGPTGDDATKFRFFNNGNFAGGDASLKSF